MKGVLVTECSPFETLQLVEALRSDDSKLSRAGRALPAAEDATRAELSPEFRAILEAAN